MVEDETLFRSMQVAAQRSAGMVHAENGDVTTSRARTLAAHTNRV